MKELLLGYLLGINLVGFLICGWDKRCARKNRWRVPERTLMLIGILGGGVGFYAGMQLFHHKTRHRKFTIGMPVLILLWAVALGLLCWRTIVP